MKKFLTVIAAVLMSVSLIFLLTGCPSNEKNDNNDDSTQSVDGVNHQFEDGVIIPPGGERVRDGDGWNHERFEDGSGDGFSVTIEGEQTFTIDESSGGGHRFSTGAIDDYDNPCINAECYIHNNGDSDCNCNGDCETDDCKCNYEN